MNFITTLYMPFSGVVVTPMGLKVAYSIESGIIQGCALSGTLFALSTAAFAEDLLRCVDAAGRGITRLCADDIGGAVTGVAHLAHVERVLGVARTVATLDLKLTKCMLAPVHAAFSPQARAATRRLLEEFVPGFLDFQIVDMIRYLGFWLGPAVTLWRQWEGPLQKVGHRVREAGSSGAPASALALAYSSKIVSVLSYLAQVLPLPSGTLGLEVGYLAQLFRIPLGVFQPHHWPQMSSWGGPRVPSWITSCAAALVRTSRVTLSDSHAVLADWKSTLRDRWDYVPLWMVGSGKLSPGHWQCDSFAEFLDRAANVSGPVVGYSTQLLTVANAAISDLAAEASGPRRIKFQRAARVAMDDLLARGGSLRDLFVQRLSKWWPAQRQSFTTLDWDAVQAVWSKCPVSWSWPAIRTLSSGWCTSYRILRAGGRERCIFGCAGPDCLHHYSFCRRLKAAVEEALNVRVPPRLFVKWGLRDPSFEAVQYMMVSYNAYHNCVREGRPVPHRVAVAHARAAYRALTLAKPLARLLPGVPAESPWHPGHRAGGLPVPPATSAAPCPSTPCPALPWSPCPSPRLTPMVSPTPAGGDSLSGIPPSAPAAPCPSTPRPTLPWSPCSSPRLTPMVFFTPAQSSCAATPTTLIATPGSCRSATPSHLP